VADDGKDKDTVIVNLFSSLQGIILSTGQEKGSMPRREREIYYQRSCFFNPITSLSTVSNSLHGKITCGYLARRQADTVIIKKGCADAHGAGWYGSARVCTNTVMLSSNALQRAVAGKLVILEG